MLINYFRGFCMALADSIPGVSGSTIAFVLGFYDRFIKSLDDLFFGNKEKKIESLKFLVRLGIGWVIGFSIAILIIASVFEAEIYKVSSLFIGLIVFAIPIVAYQERESLKGKYRNAIFAILGIIIVVALSILNPISGEGINVAVDSLSFGLCIYTFFAAMMAICAMVVPGISGSTLLLIFGLYIPIVGAVKNLLHMDFAYFPILCVFGLGIITGVAVIIRLVRKCLEKYRSKTIYMALGLMIGSIYSIILGPTTLEVVKPALSFETFDILFFVIGGIIIFGLQRLKGISNTKVE